MKYTLLTALLCASAMCFGQNVDKNCNGLQKADFKVSTTELPTIDNFDGSFQFRMRADDSFAITTNLLERIKLERKANEDVLLNLGNNRSVMILSEDHLLNASWERFSTPYSFL